MKYKCFDCEKEVFKKEMNDLENELKGGKE